MSITSQSGVPGLSNEVRVKTKVYTTATATASALTWKLRKGSTPLKLEVVHTNAVGTVTAAVGTSATTNHYVASVLTTNAAAQVSPVVSNGLIGSDLTADTEIYTSLTAAPGAGTVMINLYYMD